MGRGVLGARRGYGAAPPAGVQWGKAPAGDLDEFPKAKA